MPVRAWSPATQEAAGLSFLHPQKFPKGAPEGSQGLRSAAPGMLRNILAS